MRPVFDQRGRAALESARSLHACGVRCRFDDLRFAAARPLPDLRQTSRGQAPEADRGLEDRQARGATSIIRDRLRHGAVPRICIAGLCGKRELFCRPYTSQMNGRRSAAMLLVFISALAAGPPRGESQAEGACPSLQQGSAPSATALTETYLAGRIGTHAWPKQDAWAALHALLGSGCLLATASSVEQRLRGAPERWLTDERMNPIRRRACLSLSSWANRDSPPAPARPVHAPARTQPRAVARRARPRSLPHAASPPHPSPRHAAGRP